MNVGRLYELDAAWWRIQRLWSKVTVFDEHDSSEGIALSLERLREFRDGITEVIDELETEQEMDEWLE